MKKLSIFAMVILSGLIILVTMPELSAQTVPAGHGKHFVDLNGDGYNDNAPDADGDGIPNGKDADYQKNPTAGGRFHRTFVDENGDGFNDNAPDADGDGIPNGQDPDYQRPLDGSGLRHGSALRNGNQEMHRVSRRFNPDARPGDAPVPNGNCDGSSTTGRNANRRGYRP